MSKAYEPSADDFKKLAKVVRENSKKMKGVYTDAASKIYAHAVHMDHSSIVSITDKLNFDEMEKAHPDIFNLKHKGINWINYNDRITFFFFNTHINYKKIGGYSHLVCSQS